MLEQGKSARTVSLTDDERAVARDFFLLTMKPTIYAANVDEAYAGRSGGKRRRTGSAGDRQQEGAECLVICAQLEAELVALPAEERRDYLKSLGRFRQRRRSP